MCAKLPAIRVLTYPRTIHVPSACAQIDHKKPTQPAAAHPPPLTQAAYLEALRAGPPPATYAEAEAQRGAETAMTGEANALLTQAGLMFMKVGRAEGTGARAHAARVRVVAISVAVAGRQGIGRL